MAHLRSAPIPAASAAAGSRAPSALLAALVAAITYAVFAHGATDTPAETRVQLALAITALLTAAALATGRPGIQLQAPRAARAGVLLLLAFAVWCGLSLLWSVAPDRTWMEFNRAVAYALVAGLGLVLGASLPRAIERVATLWLVVAVLVALYALGGKTFPSVNVPGLFDFNQTGTLVRLRAPLQYWNALALVLVMAVPVALGIAVDGTRTTRVRILAVLSVYLLVLDVGMTYSRGGVLALVAALAVLTVLGGARLRSLLVMGLAGAGAALPLAVAFSRAGLKTSGAGLGLRIHDGRILAIVVVLVALALVVAVRALLAFEDRVRWTAARTATLGKLAAILAAVAVVAIIAAAAASPRGLPGAVHERARGFTVATQDKQLDPARLATTTSGNRWVWWKEAAGATSDRPLGGWGAGSFRVTHLRYRTNTIAVTQPHSVPLQFLAETGLVGLLLVYGGVGLLLWSAIVRVRGLPGGRERELAVALLAAAVAWLGHGLYDWDWDIPGVTFPPLLFLGVLAASRVAGRTPALAPGGRVVVFADPEREARLRTGALPAIAAVTLAVFAYAASAVLPAWSAGKADAAQEAIGGDQVSEETLRQAAAQADLAARIDPLSVEPLLVAATIAQRRGRLTDARQDLLEAVDRQPDSGRAWSALATLALTLADRQGFEDATARALALDPHNPLLRSLAARALAFQAPPGDSATATGTPLPMAAPVAPVTLVAPVAPVTPTASAPPRTSVPPAPGGPTLAVPVPVPGSPASPGTP